jgi:hypothetical protein
MKLTKRSPLLFLALGLAMMIMSACGPGSSSTPSTLTPLQVVQKSADAMKKVNSSHIDINATFTANGVNVDEPQMPSNVAITLKGSGDQSIPDKQQQLDLTLSYNNISTQVSDVITGDKAYVKYQGQWYVVDKAQLDQYGVTSNLLTGISIDENSLLNLLEHVTINDHGNENLNGQSLRHITANMDKEAFKQLLLTNPQLKGTFNSKDLDALKTFSATADLFIDETNFYVHRTELKVNLGADANGTTVSMNLDLTIDLSKFNEPVKITVPTDAKPLDPQQLPSDY